MDTVHESREEQYLEMANDLYIVAPNRTWTMKATFGVSRTTIKLFRDAVVTKSIVHVGHVAVELLDIDVCF